MVRRSKYALIRCDLTNWDSDFNNLTAFEQWLAFVLLASPAERPDGSLAIDFDFWASRACDVDSAHVRIAFYSLLMAGWIEVVDDRVFVSERIGKRPAGPFSLARMERSKLTKAMRRDVYEQCGDTCQGCGDTAGPFHIDHVHPVSKGGLTVPENLTLLCAPCNLLKRDGSWDEFLRKLEDRR